MFQSQRYKQACLCLDLSPDQEIKPEDIKRQYRRKALQFHPDKNTSENAADEFRNVRESYEYLMENGGFSDQSDGDDKNAGYQNVLFSFLGPILKSDMFQEIKSKAFFIIIDKITSKCESKALGVLDKMDKKILAKIYEILFAYKDAFHITEDFLRKVEEILKRKTQNDECIILNPFLDDLFENNLYKLVENGEKYVIPLWHHELVYDNKGADLYVKCIPILPDNMEIDEYNNIHVNAKCSVNELWLLDYIEIDLGKQKIKMPRRQIKMTEQQTIIMAGMGISKINVNDIYDISKRADVYVNLTIDNS
jgi:DnaJ-class molecular chaperone